MVERKSNYTVKNIAHNANILHTLLFFVISVFGGFQNVETIHIP